MTRNHTKRWLAPTVLAAVSLSLVLGVVPTGAQGQEVPGNIYARVTQHELTMNGWPPGAELTVQVDGVTYLATVSGTSHADVQDVALAPGTAVSVEVTDGPGLGLRNELVVSPVAITSVDYANDLVHGVALQSVTDPRWTSTLVQVCTGWWVGGSSGGGCRWVPTDQTVPTIDEFGQGVSTWTADFSQPGDNPWGGTEPVVDLRPYWMGIEVGQQSLPVGVVEVRTMVSPTQLPYLDVQYRSDWDPPASGDAVALGFDEGTSVHFTLLQDGQPVCSQDASVQPAGEDPSGWYRWLPWAPFDVWAEGCNPSPGDLLVADGTFLGGPLHKELTIVTPLNSSGEVGVDVDVTGDLIQGTVPAGYDVEAAPWDGSGVQVLVPDGVTRFTADFSTADPPYDVQPWSWFGVQVLDPDGDLVDTQLRALPLVFSVDPSSGLVGGQVVQLVGHNVTPGTATAMQGYGFIGGLDESTAMELTVAPDGSFSVPYRVQQFLTVPTGPEHDEFVTVDCGALEPGEGSCFVAVMVDPDWAMADTHFLPATVGLSVSPTATLVKASGRVIVSGSVSCSTLGDDVQVDGTLTQRVGRKALATGAFTVTVSCDTATWTASVRPSGTVPFGTGTAEVLATGTLMVGSWNVSTTVAQLVSIKAVKR